MRSRHLQLLIAVAIGCTEPQPPCLPEPCPQFVAVEITLTGSPAGTPLTTASYRVRPGDPPVPCNQGPAANKCEVMGGPGTYQIEVSAMSYTAVQRTIVVPAKPAARCACQFAGTQVLTIAMSPTS